jgi:hypothetical protein
MSLETAAAWYEYGNVLLLKEEESPEHDVLGNVQSESKEQVEDDEVGEEDEAEAENDEDQDRAAEAGDGAEEDEPEGDLQIAWEALDVRDIMKPTFRRELN